VSDHHDLPVDIMLDELDASDKIKKMIKTEFYEILSLLNFNSFAHDIFRRWYVDRRLPYHIIIMNQTLRVVLKN